jgi:hypothetical protein
VGASAGKTTTDRTQARQNQILPRHTPPLSAGAAEMIKTILQETEARNSK